MDKIVNFGYNTNNLNGDYQFESIGTKYNFNISGKFLGIFKMNDKSLLFTQIEKSFGDDCMKDTVDVREITKDSVFLLSNNDQDATYTMMAAKLSTTKTKEELNQGIPLELTTGFKSLLDQYKLDREEVYLDDSFPVCGKEKGNFEDVKAKNKSNSISY